MRLYRRRQLVVLGALLLSIGNHGINVLAIYCSAKTFEFAPGQIPPFAWHLIFVPWGLGFRGLIPLPGGVGIGEFVVGGLYELLGYLNENGILASFGHLVINWTLAGFGLIIFTQMNRMAKARQPKKTV